MEDGWDEENRAGGGVGRSEDVNDFVITLFLELDFVICDSVYTNLVGYARTQKPFDGKHVMRVWARIEE